LALKAETQRGRNSLDEVDEDGADAGDNKLEHEQVKKLMRGPTGQAAMASNAVAQASVSVASSKNKFQKSARPEPEPEDSQKRMAIMAAARKVNLKTRLGSTVQAFDSNPDTGKDIGQRLDKKSKKFQDALPLIPKHLRKQLVGGKEYPDAAHDFYRDFKYVYVDMPEPEEDFPCEF
jgi:hypothetical protein